MIKKSIIATILSTSVLIMSGSAFANDHSQVDNVQKKSSDCIHKKCDVDSFSFGPFKGIDLTKEQKEKIKALHKQRIEEKDKSLDPRSNMKDLMKLNGEIREEVYSKDYSPEKIKEIFSKYSRSFEDKIVYQSDIENKIFNVLTDEQKVVYKKNQKDFEKRMEEFGKHRNFGRPDFNKMKDMPPRPQEGAPMPPPRDERELIQNLKSD